jgi:hypothetical protein
MCIYVDDIYLTCNDSRWVEQFRKGLDELAPHKSLGEISYALGCEVSRTDDGVTITCLRKIDELLRRTGMEEASPLSTPLKPDSKIMVDMGGTRITDRARIKAYQRSAGSLLYIMRGGRPDLSHAAWYIACGMTEPTEEMEAQLRHCLRYLRGSRDFVLRYSKSICKHELDLSSTAYTSNELIGFSDANHEPEKCTGGTFTMFLNAVLYWRVKKLTGVQLSTVQAELTTLSELARDIILLQDVFEFVDIPCEKPTTLFCDSKGAIQNAKHPTFTERLRHALNRIFFVRDTVYRNITAVRFIPGTLNPADLGTKALGARPFRLFAQFLMNDELSAQTKAQRKRVSRSAYRV